MEIASTSCKVKSPRGSLHYLVHEKLPGSDSSEASLKSSPEGSDKKANEPSTNLLKDAVEDVLKMVMEYSGNGDPAPSAASTGPYRCNDEDDLGLNRLFESTGMQAYLQEQTTSSHKNKSDLEASKEIFLFAATLPGYFFY